MDLARGDEGGVEVLEAGECGSLGHQPVVPEGGDPQLELLLHGLLGPRGGEGDEGVREGVLGGKVSEGEKPGGGEVVVEGEDAMGMEQVVGAEEGNHGEERECLDVEDPCGRDGARQEMDHTGWGARVAMLQPLQCTMAIFRK